MPKQRPYTLSVAGFDPSGGAGLNADIKVFEKHKTLGLSVCTATTVQDEDALVKVSWNHPELVLEQLEVLLKRYPINFAKIGLIQNAEVLDTVLTKMQEKGIKSIWDPILSSSSGFDFHTSPNDFMGILEKCYLITPNWHEYQSLFGNNFDPNSNSDFPCSVYVKGGHNAAQLGKDYLVSEDVKSLNPKPGNYSSKHGSGCILSAAICANLSKGFPLLKACYRAKRYTEQALNSNKTQLAWH